MQSSHRESGFFCEVNGLNVQEVQTYLEESNIPFEESELYVAAQEKTIVDTSLRKSKFRKCTDSKLFDLVEPFVSRLSEEDSLLQYTLRRSDVTHIKYEAGGFFGRHTDYLSVSSNLLEEFSFLVCVTPAGSLKPTQGGKTVVHMHRHSHTSNATTTPGCGIAFRKDLEHEGTLLEAGEKHIIMLNLWATRKDSGGFLLVHFGINAKDNTRTTEDALRQLACDQSYLIPIVEAKRSPRLAAHIQSSMRDECCCCQGTGTVEHFGVCPLCEGKCFFDTVEAQSCQSKLNSTAAVTHYQCEDCDYDTFRTLFHILRRMYVSAQEVQTHAELIASYGLDTEHVLIDTMHSVPGSSTEVSSTQNSASSEELTKVETGKHEVSIYLMNGSLHSVTVAGTDSVRSLKNELKRQAGLSGIALFAPNCEHPLKDSDTIADCGFPLELFTVQRLKKVDEHEVLGLTGDEVRHITDLAPPASSTIEDNASDVIVCESLERTQVVAKAAIEAGLPYVSFRVLFIEGELVIRGDTCRPCNHKFKMDPIFISVGDCQHVLGWGSASSDWEGDCRWWEEDVASRQPPRNPALFNLHRVLRRTDNAATQISDVMQNVFGDSTHKRSRRGVKNLTAPLGDPDEIYFAPRENDGKLFYVNAQGETTFTQSQADAASSHLRDIFFIDQIKDRLNKVPWQFPQDSEARSETLCNEQVYGHTIIMFVSGVVRLHSNLDLDESSKQEHRQYLKGRYVK
jgi:hypothetical protein